MIRQSVMAAGALLCTLSTVARAQTDTSQCDLKTSHFAVTRAILYIQNASSAQDTTRKKQALESANRSLLEAMQQGQETSVAAWYYLGTYYYMVDDAAGADSAFDRVETLAPNCMSDTEQYRQGLWARVANQGIEGLRTGDLNVAKDRFTFANSIYSKDPTTYFYLGTVYATEDNADSALANFREAAVKAIGDTAYAEIREKSVQNLARIYEVVETWDSAAVYFRAYQEIRPDDSEALTGLARALTASGDTAAAEAVYDGILANPGATDPLELFRIGVALFRAERPAKAVGAFEAGLQRLPFHRNGLFNLTNAYFSLAQAASGDSARMHATKMLAAAHRLLQIDPASSQIMRLMAAGFQLSGQSDSTDAWLKRIGDLKFEVDIQAAQPTSEGYYLAGTLVAAAPSALQAVQDSLTRDSTRLESLKAQLASGGIPAAQRPQARQRQTTLERRVGTLRTQVQRHSTPVSVPAMVFEFLNAEGQVVASETVAAQSVEPKGRKQFELRPAGEGIVAFRYTIS
ncbi:MAG TPA: tetratricopeptide repeat protein [Gemmatimonadales bacterium]